MLYSPLRITNGSRRTKAANGENQNAGSVSFLVATSIEKGGLCARLQFVPEATARSPTTAMLFLTFASHCRRAQRISFTASGQRENMNSIHAFVAAH
jgi:hypothetical protein